MASPPPQSPLRESAASEGLGTPPPGGAGAGVDDGMRVPHGCAPTQHAWAARCVRAQRGLSAFVVASFGGAMSDLMKIKQYE